MTIVRSKALQFGSVTEGYRKAFANFAPVLVARFTEAHMAKLMLDPGIIHNKLKIEAAVHNARQFLQIVIYSHMQAAGLINDHLVTCYRHRECQAPNPDHSL